ncbi:autotransporter-associated N-terminal domain-containing protein [Fusobacterium hwasookii]|uniref:autotransporter-associated N-terminal domain-containing protein n=1 Tax=Fusobacterium hwasookii TaxID=1583098 RepID=UPI001C6F1B52|nr:autotransporter-associated N-terminal domain-containing protein [Fusobacterium hwasookii]QYR54309.1 autotransporter-associated N-terminal domain-containing protein [Fusobacterium hwasookii]
MGNNLSNLEKNLRSIAKRYKNVKYSIGLAILFLMMGVSAFSEEVVTQQEVMTTEQIATSKENLKNSIGSLQSKIDSAKAENEKGLAGLRLELIQLMEQGDQVVKSPWSSWQFGANYMYSKWNGTYKGRGDKAEKYPYEGVFTRSNDLFLRNISPDSDVYNQYVSSVKDDAPHSATTSTIKQRGGSTNYGLASVIKKQEPIVTIELGTSVKPKNITKSPVTVTPPSISVNTVSPLSTPTLPGAPELPEIEIANFDPSAPKPITVSLTTPPTFNIKLGSFCNNIHGCSGEGIDGGPHSGPSDNNPRSYDHGRDAGKELTSADLKNKDYSVRYSWSRPNYHNGALLKMYFDFGNVTTKASTPGGSISLSENLSLTIDSIRGNIEPANNPAVNGNYNKGTFLTGGSRIATLDNATDATINNKAKINMIGPLVVGFEIQSDVDGSKKREVINSGVISDEIEKSDQTIDTTDTRLNELLKIKQLKADGSGLYGTGVNPKTVSGADSTTLTMPPFTNQGTLDVLRDPDIVNPNGSLKKAGGYTGYKIGIILTYENSDKRLDTNYVLTNKGTINFQGRRSIGIQVYAPGKDSNWTNEPIVNVKNEGAGSVITMGGVASYGLKVSSRIMDKSTVENEGTINIIGDNTATYKQNNNPGTLRTHIYGDNGNSLSSGIAVIEDDTLENLFSVRAHQGIVLNKGIINVSGGYGNTGMFLKVKANDDITNKTGTINVTGSKNIGMRVDLGTTKTDQNSLPNIIPKAYNEATITITNGEENIGMVANNSESSGGKIVHKAIAENKKDIVFVGKSFKAIGMFSQDGGEIVNAATGKITGPATGGLEGTLGMVIQPKVAPKNVASSGINNGEINLSGTKVTGIYNQGTFTMENGVTGTASVTTSGEGSISLYAKGETGNPSTTNINSGKIVAKDKALGLFADDTTINLGTSTVAPELEAHGKGTLLFYNYTKNPSNLYEFKGKFKVSKETTAKLTTGATAFYLKDTTPNKAATPGVTGTTGDRLDTMFTGSTDKVKLTLDNDSTLFVLDNTTPNTTAVPLSSVDPSQINDYLGSHVILDSVNSGRNFKAYKASRATLSVDTDVDLDNHTSPSPTHVIDKYYRVDFLNSSVTVEAGKKMYGTDTGKLKQVIAQANVDGGSINDIKVINHGTIDYSKKGAAAIVVDYGQATNNGLIKMDAANSSTENSIGLFGASSSKLTNSATGEIQLGTRGVGIWGAHKIDSSVSTWSKNIDITNNGKITGLSGKTGVFGIYAVNDTATYPGATSNIVHGATGNIDLSQSEESVGIYMTNGTLTSSGNISVNNKSVGLDATTSDVTVSGGTHTIGKESVGFKLTGSHSGTVSKNSFGNSGNISITGEDSVVYLLKNMNLTSGTNFKDDLSLSSTKSYTYINADTSRLNYENTKTIDNDDSMFINAKNSYVTLLAGTDISSTNKEVKGVYSEGGYIYNKGTLTLTGDKSAVLYGKASSISNEAPGKITVGKDGSGIYVKGNISDGTNYGEITIGEGSVGIRAEDATITNGATGKILSIAKSATGMSQSGGNQDIINNGTIKLTGDKSTALHSEGITTANHKVINTGNITVGDSSSELTPSVGIFSANSINSTVESSGKVTAGIKSTGIYAGNINLTGNSETTTGDGGIGLYSKEGTVNISAGSKITVGATLGNGQEGTGVYLAGNNQTLNSDTDQLTIGQGSVGYVMTGQGNTVRTGVAGTTGVVTLSKDSVYMYSADKTGNITNYTNLRSMGDENYGIYAPGAVSNYGNIDFSQGVGNVGTYSYLEGATTTPNAIRNYGTISVSKTDISDPDNRKYGIGMAAGFGEEVPAGSGNYVVKGLGNIENYGTIKVTTPDSIGMYATGTGSKIYNNGRIELSGPKRNIGIFAENGAEVINNGTITTVGTGNVGQIGIAMRKGAILTNNGTIHIDATKGYGLFLAGVIVRNYGTANITTGSGATPIKEVTAADTSKEMQDLQDEVNKVKIHSPAGAAEAKIIANGRVQTPTVVHVQAIPNRKPNDIPTSSIGMYIDTSGINYTRPITNIGALRGLTQSDLIIGVEATKYTTAKYIQLGQDIIEPYNDMIRTSGIEKWSIYSGSLTWMASITQLPDFTIRNAYLAKIPYTVWAGRESTPVDSKDTFNFLDGLEQRYGVEGIGTRENQVFQKLNSIGNNEEILFFQAIDEMMGHQYANVQQRVQSTGIILDKEFNYLRDEWRTASKDSNKIKTFGTNGEYKTDTAGVIDYKNNAYGVAYIHENEDIKLGRGVGWYTGIVHNTFRFKDIGRSKEQMLQAKVGLLKSVPFDDNNSLNWRISGDIFVGRNRMHRKFLVVDEVFHAKSKYYTYGVGVKNEIGKEFRLSESFTLRPYAALKLEYGRVGKIREKSGEIKLEVKHNDYFSVRPELGAELGFKHYFGMKALRTTLGVAYENELGRVANGKNKARVVDTTADWFNIRGEKEDRKGNIKVDLNVGVDNTRVGVTANVGYDTKGENLRGGLGLRIIF